MAWNILDFLKASSSTTKKDTEQGESQRAPSPNEREEDKAVAVHRKRTISPLNPAQQIRASSSHSKEKRGKGRVIRGPMGIGPNKTNS